MYFDIGSMTNTKAVTVTNFFFFWFCEGEGRDGDRGNEEGDIK